MQPLSIIGLTLLGVPMTAPACSFRNAQLLQPPATVAHTPPEMLSIPPPLTVHPGELQVCDRAWIREEMGLGRQVRPFAVEARDVRGRQRIAEGTTIGYKRLLRLKEVAASPVRLAILDSRACPAISEFRLFKALPRSGKSGRSRSGERRRKHGC